MIKKLSDADVVAIRTKFAYKQATPKELAYDFGVCYPTINRIIHNKRRQNTGNEVIPAWAQQGLPKGHPEK